MTRYLCHHGVKGQQWGVRNGPPYPIEDKVLRKGTKLSNVSSTKNTSDYLKNLERGKRWIYTFQTNDAWDTNIYTGAFASYLRDERKQSKLYKHDYEVKQDLKMPTSNERMAVLKDMIKTNEKDVLSDLDSMANLYKKYMAYGYSLGEKHEQASAFDSKGKKDKTYYENAKLLFDALMENSQKYESTKEYSRRMAEKYDAMVDDNNVNIYNFAHDPIILFKANSYLEAIGKRNVFTGKVKGTRLSDTEIDANTNKVREQNYKKSGRWYAAF